MKFLVTYFHRFYPSAIRFQGADRLQKKHRRLVQGLTLPIRCPRCRMKTRQVLTKPGLRRCLSCRTEFSRWDSRHGIWNEWQRELYDRRRGLTA